MTMSHEEQMEEWEKGNNRDNRVQREWLRNEIAIAALKFSYHNLSACEWQRYVTAMREIEAEMLGPEENA